MNTSSITQPVAKFVAQNSSAILTAVGVAGTVATAVLAAKAGAQAAFLTVGAGISEQEGGPKVSRKDLIKTTAPLFIPPVVCGTVTVGAIIMANRISTKRAAALAASYAISERSLKEYKVKVAEMFGEKKERKVSDSIAEDQVKKSREIVVIGAGDAKFFDRHSGRYFRSTMDKVLKAENMINAEIAKHEAASLSEFYDAVGLPPNGWSDQVGWNVANRLELYHTTTVDENGDACMAIEFVTPPDPEYARHF